MRILLCSILFAMTLGGFAQQRYDFSQKPPSEHRHDRLRFDVGFGIGGSQSQFKRTISVSQVQDNTPHNPLSFTWPAIHVEGEYAIAEQTSVGVHYDFWQDEQWFKISNDVAIHHNTINTWMASVRQYWNGHDHTVSIYSGLMLGASFEHFYQYKITGLPTTDVTRMALHTTLIGFRFGDRMGASTELGIGTKGLVSLGLSLAL
jgi:hypothetical protein